MIDQHRFSHVCELKNKNDINQYFSLEASSFLMSLQHIETYILPLLFKLA